MFNPPTAPNRAGNLRGIRAAAGSLALGALSLMSAHAAFGAETVSSVLKKMAENYTKAKSYQATITTVQVAKTPDGKPYTVTETEQVKYENPNRFRQTVKATGTGAALSGQLAQQIQMLQHEIVSDGKTATIYVPARKMYQKQPVPPNLVVAQIVQVLRLVPPLDRPGLTLLPSGATVNGRQAYVVEMKPTAPPNLKPDQAKQFAAAVKRFKQYPRLLIDKQNYNLLQYTLSTTDGSAQIDLSSQVFGGAIPGSTFAFNPPAGVKEYKAPPPAMHPNIGGFTPGGVPAPGVKPK
ncbi:MAG TPA: DUF2092 domain-containing protein [Chthonomonadaceae bacterium]|nr:DUF2092 domain-containing protein [Chthonomonadaceae bacterium]